MAYEQMFEDDVKRGVFFAAELGVFEERNIASSANLLDSAERDNCIAL